MEERVIIAYAILLVINTGIFILCIVQMRKFSRFHRNFNKVVSNVQSYLRYVMAEDEDETAEMEAAGQRSFEQSRKFRERGSIMELDAEIPDKGPMPEKQKEEILNSVLGEIFS